LECVAGSHAYGLNRAGSDEDRRGIFMVPSAAYLSTTDPPTNISDGKSDITFYSLRRFAQLAAGANPNMLEVIFAPQENIVSQSPHAEPLLKNRAMFLSRACFQSHVQYANSQIHKARGRNKWINRPQPKEAPLQQEFCWFVPREASASNPPMRPIRFSESNVNLAHCHAAAVEHSTELFRIYEYGPEARGVFRGAETLVLESIPIEDEATRFVGTMIFNRMAYDAAIRDHHNYWEWREKRNDARWDAQERGELDYDAKNMMHTIRLLMAAESLLRDGVLRIRFDGADRDFLLSIRDGKFEYDYLIAEAERRTAELATLLENSPLPERPDFAGIDRVLLEVQDSWEHARA
jgi:hypothetical protein